MHTPSSTCSIRWWRPQSTTLTATTCGAGCPFSHGCQRNGYTSEHSPQPCIPDMYQDDEVQSINWQKNCSVDDLVNGGGSHSPMSCTRGWSRMCAPCDEACCELLHGRATLMLCSTHDPAHDAPSSWCSVLVHRATCRMLDPKSQNRIACRPCVIGLGLGFRV